MNVRITTFTHPFSFFCIPEQKGTDHLMKDVETNNCAPTKIGISDTTNGQYVAVLWKNKWVRGIVSLETNFLIWLIDDGIYLRPDDNIVYINLPSPFKKLPTKVFEASIHGVVPVDRVLSDECEIQNRIGLEWTGGIEKKVKSLLAGAIQVYFVPIAMMSTPYNDVVLGDLYLELKPKKLVNIVNELEMWPVFLERNKAVYIENLKHFYVKTRKHRACTVNPACIDPDLPTMNLETTLAEYSAISDAARELDTDEKGNDSDDSSTEFECSSDTAEYPEYKETCLSEAEIEKYSNKHVIINGKKFNALEILTNKLRDFNMCERYKDDDGKSVGRGSHWCPKQSREF